jgi:hypothetical protein
MTSFRAELQHLADRLDLPEPARTRILLEVAGDLEAAHEAARADGLDDDSARRRALDYCDLSDHALRDLAAVHGTALRQVLDALPGTVRRLWERGLLVAIVLMLTVTAGAVVGAPGFWARSSVFVQPLALLAVAATATALVRVYALWIRADHHPSRLRRGHGLLLALALAMVAWGAFGFWCELAWAAGRLRAAFADGMPATLDWLLRGSGLLVVSLVAGLLTGLGWAALQRKAARCELAALEALLEIET